MSTYHGMRPSAIIVPSLSHSISGQGARSMHPYSPKDHIDSNPPIVPSQTDLHGDRTIRRDSVPSSLTFRRDHTVHHKPDPSAYTFRHDDPTTFHISADTYRVPGPTLTQAQSQSVFRFSPGSRIIPKQPHERKPVLACLFCRKRKIACGPAHPDADDRTCNQCSRRNLECTFPKESRRGFRKGVKGRTDSQESAADVQSTGDVAMMQVRKIEPEP